MESIIAPIATLVTEIFRLINTENSRKYIDRVDRIKRELLEEESRGYNDQNDAKIEALYKELKLAVEAAQSELLASLSRKSQ